MSNTVKSNRYAVNVNRSMLIVIYSSDTAEHAIALLLAVFGKCALQSKGHSVEM